MNLRLRISFTNKEKNMRIILLSGETKTGKTATFLELYEIMKPDMKNLNDKQGIIKNNHRDFQCDFLYKDRKIALYSLGDIMYLIYEAMIKYSEFDYLVLAHNNSGKEMSRIADAIDKYPQHTLIKKTVSKNVQNQKDDNLKDCKRIITAIIVL